MRTLDSSYGKDVVEAVVDMMHDLRISGHTVRSTREGDVIVDGVRLPAPEFEALALDGDPGAVEEWISEPPAAS